MGVELKTKALVLHEMQVGDYDKRLILLSKEYGKITAFAKGAKKPNSKLFAGSQIFCYGDFILFKGKNNYNVNQVNLIESFHSLRQNIDALTYGLYFLEFTEFISLENHLDHDLMKLVLKSLKQLEVGHLALELICKIFELKAMSYLGYAPWITSCVSCNSSEPEILNHFSSKDGGVLCDTCNALNHSIEISETTRYTMDFIIREPIETLFKFHLNDQVFKEFNKIMEQFLDFNLNKKFKALNFFKLEY